MIYFRDRFFVGGQGELPDVLPESRAEFRVPAASHPRRIHCSIAWGQDKKTILLTSKALIEPVLSYAAALWFPSISNRNNSKLQQTENQALLIATISVLKSDIQNLHSETKKLSLSNHLTMLCS